MNHASIFSRKPLEQLQAETQASGLRKVLTPMSIVLLGIGCIVGAGIYVIIGPAAAEYAGPGVMLSFLLAGAACALTGLSYAELASAIPTAGSSYTYCYVAMGEVYAWILGWLLMLEYGLAGSALAVGFSGYFKSLLTNFGIHIPAALSTSLLHASKVHGNTLLTMGHSLNIIAVFVLAIIAVILVLGVSTSSYVNTILVVIKLSVLAAFIIVGFSRIDPGNWTPFIPANEGGFTYGWAGVFRGSSILFFAYLGFETVSTASTEAKNPQRAMPIGILGSLAASTLLYILVAAVLTGIVPFRELGVADPLAIAADRIGWPHFAIFIKVGALTGLASVLLVNGFGHSRICYAMARDGLLPTIFGNVHPRFQTPWLGCILVCLIAAVLASLFPISVLADLVSIGTALAFIVVSLSLMWLRTVHPDIPRPFRVPFGGFRIGKIWIGYTPVAAIIMSIAVILPVSLDIISQARQGEIIPAAFLIGYGILGAAIYVYLRSHRKTGKFA